MKKNLLLLSTVMIFGVASAQVTTNSTTTKQVIDEPIRDTLKVETQVKTTTDLKNMDAVKTKDHVKTSTAPSTQQDVKSAEITPVKSKQVVKRKTQTTTTK